MSLAPLNKKIPISLFLRLFLPAVFVGVIFYFLNHPYTLSSNIVPPPNSTVTPATFASSSNPILNPSIIKIPSIGLSAPIQHVGKTPSGSMAVPTNFTDVGWYKYGTIPGAQGNAVIDGHVDNALGLAGVFKNLKKLKPGDIVSIENSEGKIALFKVTKLQVYPYNRAPIEEIFGKTDKFALNLITCSGTWLPGARTSSDRLVVYTELITP